MHLSALKLSCQSFDHVASLSISNCSEGLSSVLFTFDHNLVSSENITIKDKMLSGRSFMKMTKRIGPNTFPWGLPCPNPT